MMGWLVACVRGLCGGESLYSPVSGFIRNSDSIGNIGKFRGARTASQSHTTIKTKETPCRPPSFASRASRCAKSFSFGRDGRPTDRPFRFHTHASPVDTRAHLDPATVPLARYKSFLWHGAESRRVPWWQEQTPPTGQLLASGVAVAASSLPRNPPEADEAPRSPGPQIHPNALDPPKPTTPTTNNQPPNQTNQNKTKQNNRTPAAPR